MTSPHVKRTGQPLWGQIVDQLAQEIIDQQIAPGTRLPTETDLMARFGVSRFTLRRAMGVLEDRGLVRVEQGRGTFVHDGAVHYRISQHISFSENLREQGKEPKQREIALDVIRPTKDVRAALDLPAGSKVIRHTTLSFADDVVVAFSNNYFPASLFPAFADHWRAQQSMIKTYEAHGFVDYRRLSTAFSARMPTPEEARQLRQPASRPVIVTRKIDASGDGRRIGYGETLWSADRVAMYVGEPLLS